MLIATQKGKQKVPTKKETYIYTYIGKERKRVKTAAKGHKKRATEKVALK